MREPTALEDYLFDLNGYVIIENAIEPTLLDALNAEFDAFPLDLPQGQWYKGAQRRDYNPATGLELHHCIEIGGPFEELIDNPGWINHVSHYCGEEKSYVEGLFIDECIASTRTEGGYHAIHSGGWRGALRGQYHYTHGEFRCGQVNVLMALTDIGPDDGPTIVIPGSHKSNFPHPHMADHSYNGARVGELPAGAIKACLKKGDALLFADGITHGGSNRNTPGERRVVIFRYGPSWGSTRYGYQYSQELLDRLTPMRRVILEPVPPCRPGDSFIPIESSGVLRRLRQEKAQSMTG